MAAEPRSCRSLAGVNPKELVFHPLKASLRKLPSARSKGWSDALARSFERSTHPKVSAISDMQAMNRYDRECCSRVTRQVISAARAGSARRHDLDLESWMTSQAFWAAPAPLRDSKRLRRSSVQKTLGFPRITSSARYG